MGKWIAVVLCVVLAASMAMAQERQALIDQIVAGGTNEGTPKRHTVRVEGCTMTTYYWRQVEGEGEVLWSSFTFDMGSASFARSNRPDSDGFISLESKTEDEPDTVVIVIEMREGVVAQHEMAMQRRKGEEGRPSSRNDGTTHYITEKDQFVIIQEGDDVLRKARLFTLSFEQYVRSYCTLTG